MCKNIVGELGRGKVGVMGSRGFALIAGCNGWFTDLNAS